jgi:outer membrane autotransporter protein
VVRRQGRGDEYLDNSSGITSQFNGAGLGSFTVNTSRPERDSALIDAGLDTQWSDAFNLFVDYTTQAGQSDFFAQSVEGGVKVSF